MRRVAFKDREGRRFISLLPEGVPDSKASTGILVGPPPLDSLGMSIDAEVRLNNQLFARGLFTAEDMEKRRHDVVAAIMATFKVDAQRIIDVARGVGAAEVEVS